MAKPTLEIADIFRKHGPAWRQANKRRVSLSQLKVMSSIEACRTEALGGHVNNSNVALEASRGLSTLHTKKYRDLKSLISGTPRKPGKNSLIDLLKAEVRVLKQNLERSELRLGEVEVTLVRAERSLEQAIATQERFAQDNKRLRRRLAEMVQN